MELGARIAWLQPAESGGYGWCGAAVLLRGELTEEPELTGESKARRYEDNPTTNFQDPTPNPLGLALGSWELAQAP